MQHETEIKSCSAVGLFLLGFACVCIPLMVRYKPGLLEKYQVTISVLMDFSGGVLFAGGMVHLLPDSEENLRHYYGPHTFPWYTLIAGSVFLLMFWIEFMFHGLSPLESDDDDDVPPINVTAEKKKDDFQVTREPSAESTDDATLIVQLTNSSNLGKYDKEDSQNNDWVMIMLAVVLDLHSIIAGFGLGCENSDQYFPILGALIAHKGFAGFALGMTMLKTKRSMKLLITIGFIFAVSTPLGLIAGWQLTEFITGPKQFLVEGILQAMVSGTFVYVSLFNILSDHAKLYYGVGPKTAHIISCALGFGLMSLLAVWT